VLDVKRSELKYILEDSRVSRLKRLLSAVMEPDSHNSQSDGYSIRSLYFDSVYNRDFKEKINGLENRKKIRLRIYGGSDIIKLELKEKFNDLCRKRSLVISAEEALCLMNRDYSVLCDKGELGKYLYFEMTENTYIPKTIVEYRRYAFIYDINDIRVTFDRDLMATEADLDLFNKDLTMYPVAPPSQITMEVKYDSFLLSFIKDAIEKADASRISNSKYIRARLVSSSLI